MLLTGIPKISFKDDRAFAVVDAQGEAPRIYSPGSELGFYFNDTRFLGVWEMVFNGMPAVALASELRFGGGTIVVSMTNRDFQKIGGSGRIPRDTFLIRKVLTFFQDTLYETVEIKNFDHEDHELQIEHWSGGRFEDVFEVRGFPRVKRGRMLPPDEVNHQGFTTHVFQYEGLDGKIRKTFVQRLYAAEKIRVSPNLAGYYTRIKVPAKGTVALKSIVYFDQIASSDFHGVPFEKTTISEEMRLIMSSTDQNFFSSLTFQSDNAILNRSIQNALTDIYMLLTHEGSGILYPYAGIPWFSAAFGRDGIVTAYQLLPWYPEVAKGVLEYVFKNQGTKNDPFTDEQPGKIFHEMRYGEMCQTREVPFIPYYGSVDSTPLALILLHEYIRWSLDLESLKRWWPCALKAMEWIEKWGDPLGTGFVEYSKQSPNGLVNQGWKDSHNSVMHADGSLARAPIRLCEVQGYAFRARMSMSAMARLLGYDGLAARYRKEALELRVRFKEFYWDSIGKYLYLALDHEMKPCTVRSSNMGHCLWSQILFSEQASDVTRLLMSQSMFSGHGIRTLADTEVSYNPLSYHNGSVWPHDNSLIMEGFRFYGQTSALSQLALGLIGVLESSDDFRLPELYCGFRKRGMEPPIPYEVACKPQAWAAGSLFLMLKAMLGISMDVDQSYLVFNSPLLTYKMNFLEVKNFRSRDWEIDFLARRASQGTSVEITRRVGNLRVLTVK